MPILSVRCLSAHETDYLHPKEPRPETCRCGLPTTDALTSAPIGNTREGRASSDPRPGATLRRETATVRIFEKGSALDDVTSDWDCPNGHYVPVVSESKPAAVTCDKCGATCTERPYVQSEDWFKPGYDQGLGCVVESRSHRKRIMAERGLVEFGDVGGDPWDDWERKQAEEARRENDEVRTMLESYSEKEKSGMDNGSGLMYAALAEAVGLK